MLAWVQHPGGPSPGTSLLRPQGAPWEPSEHPCNLTHGEQESLCSQLGWDFAQSLVPEL